MDRRKIDGLQRAGSGFASLREHLLRSHLLVAAIGVAVVAVAVAAAIHARAATLHLATAEAPQAAHVVRTIDVGLGVLLAMFTAAAATSLIVSIRAADRITRRLARLAEATEAFADRTGSDAVAIADLPIERDDEIGRLTDAFNRMRASVVAAERALSRRAVEATRAHEALAAEMLERTQAEAMFRQLLEATPDAIFIVDRSGTIVLVSAATERLLDYRRQELVGASIGRMLPAALQWTALGVAPNGSVMPEPEVLAVRRDGATVPVEIRANPLVIDDRNLVAIAVRDVTERHRAAQALRELNAELEQRVYERTAELRRSNEELERFAAVASHDLQEPLRMVASYTQLLAERYRGRLDGDADEFIAYTVDGAQRMQRLVRDLLAYARVSSRARDPEVVDAGPILERAIANLRLAIAERDATVTFDPMPRVRADASQLGQVLQNLLDNALKFHGDRPPRVHVGAERTADGWVISVRDNGIGIPREHAERVFTLFERLQRDPARPGSGIGLALARKIVERHGGRVWVEPASDGGTVVRFTLPGGPGAEAAQDPEDDSVDHDARVVYAAAAQR